MLRVAHRLAGPCNCFCHRQCPLWNCGRERCRWSRLVSPGCSSSSDPGCTIPEMEKEIQETGTAFCLSEGYLGCRAFSFCFGEFYCYSRTIPDAFDPRLAKRIRRVMFISGLVLFGLAILDHLQWLPTSNSESIADVIKLPFDPWMVQILFAVVGTLLIRGPKYELSEFEENYQRLESSREKERRVKVFNEKARSMSPERGTRSSQSPARS